MKPQIGEKWRRANGTIVEIADQRMNRNTREVMLKPIAGKGRTSWKWDDAVARELTRCD